MSDFTAMVLMVSATLMALSVIWGTYLRRRLLAKAAIARR